MCEAEQLRFLSDLAANAIGERSVGSVFNLVQSAPSHGVGAGSVRASHRFTDRSGVAVRTLTPEEMDRLVRSNRNLKISALVALAAIIPLMAATGAAGVSPGLGGVVGILIGLLLLIPQRRLLSELGLTAPEAKEILRRAREERSGLAALSPEARAARDTTRANIYLVLGLVFTTLLCVSVIYFAGQAGETHEEGTPTDPWFAASVFGIAAGFALGPAFLYTAKRRRDVAREWRNHVDQV